MSKVNNTCFASLISLIFCALSLLVTACAGTGDRAVWVSRDGKILKNGNAEYFIGTNLWYAGRLASDEDGRARLCRELDTLKSLGVTNLRVLAVEGEDPAGLEYALDRMEERGMCAVLFLNNAWEWSHGYADYLEAAGAGSQPRPSVEGYSAYMKAMASFCTDSLAVALNHEYIRRVVPEFRDHPAIFSWQICNEPRCFSDVPENRDAFVRDVAGRRRPVRRSGSGGSRAQLCLCYRLDNHIYNKGCCRRTLYGKSSLTI